MADRYDPRFFARPLTAPSVASTSRGSELAAERERAAIGVQPRSLKPASVSGLMPPQSDCRAPAASQAKSPPAARATRAPHPASAEVIASSSRGRRNEEGRAAAADRSRFAPPPGGTALVPPRTSAPAPEPQWDELADAASFDVGREGERGAGDEETREREDLGEQLRVIARTKVSRSRFQSSSRKLEHRPRRRGLLIGGLVLAVALAASVTYVMLRGESSVATPPIVTADATPAKVVPADNAPADERTKPVARGAGEVAAAQPGLDDAALGRSSGR